MKRSRVRTISMYLVLIIPLIATLWGVLQVLNGAVAQRDLVLFACFYIWTMFGVTIGYHRYLTHGGFKTNKCVEVFFVLGGLFSWEQAAPKWVGVHRAHHQYSDEIEKDPHTPREGLWHAHFGWLLKPSSIDYKRYVPDLLQNHLVMWLSARFALWSVLSLVGPFIIGVFLGFMEGGHLLEAGLTAFMWGGLIRVCLVHHFTWAINSVCHAWGYRTYNTKDNSRNVWWLALSTGGESFHNNHHRFPTSAFHGLRWFEFDPSGWFVRVLEVLGLVWDVKRPKKDQDQVP